MIRSHEIVSKSWRAKVISKTSSSSSWRTSWLAWMRVEGRKWVKIGSTSASTTSLRSNDHPLARKRIQIWMAAANSAAKRNAIKRPLALSGSHRWAYAKRIIHSIITWPCLFLSPNKYRMFKYVYSNVAMLFDIFNVIKCQCFKALQQDELCCSMTVLCILSI